MKILPSLKQKTFFLFQKYDCVSNKYISVYQTDDYVYQTDRYVHQKYNCLYNTITLGIIQKNCVTNIFTFFIKHLTGEGRGEIRNYIGRKLPSN